MDGDVLSYSIFTFFASSRLKIVLLVVPLANIAFRFAPDDEKNILKEE